MVDRNRHQNVSTLPKRTKQVVKPAAVLRRKVTPMPASSPIRTAEIPLWKQAKLWMVVFAVLILGAIGYGIWLPHAILPALVK